ncbi:MAG: BON domain-containing protein [Paracoccaceae bacterium]|nr:BON domain-containing protein [Paracoccaceae bacterium]
MKSKTILAAACLCGLALTACAPALVGGGAVIGRSVAQERTTMDALKDKEIEIKISHELSKRSGELYRDIAVDVVEGRVLLTGSVPEPEDKVTANQVAWSVEGVSSVQDELTVAEDSSVKSYFTDVRISNSLRFKLLSNSKVSSQNYNVETINRVVHITGLAKSNSELDRVIRYAQEIKGVERVVSHVLTIDDPRRVKVTGTESAG